MSQSTRNEYLKKMRFRYAKRNRSGRSKLLDEFCEVTAHERKYAIKLLRGQRCAPGRSPKKRGVAKTYSEEVGEVLFEIWRHAEQPCGKRLKPIVKLWLPAYEARHKPLEKELKTKVLKISPAQIDRVLAPRKIGASRRKSRVPKAHAAIKAIVPIRAENWDVSEPGWFEADTVAHCGGSLQDSFIWSLCATDIFSAWTEVRPSWNRGQYNVCEAFEAIEKHLPMSILGVDTDNGGEFLNHHLHGYFTERAEAVEMTRSRPYHKNDQAHVEQKNHTHVRQLLGHDRLGYDLLVQPVFELFEGWCVWHNFFCPTLKQIEKRREGSKLIRRHEREPKTPCDRLIKHFMANAEPGRAEELARWRELHDPFELKDWIEDKLSQVWELEKALREAEQLGELDLEGVAAPILGANLRSAPIAPQNRERLLSSKTNPNQDAVASAKTDQLAA